MLALGAGGCANKYPVPGGTDDINSKCFDGTSNMAGRVAEMPPGMAEGDVFANLCPTEQTLTKLDRREIRIALLGGDNVLFSGMDTETDTALIRSLYGYRVTFKRIKSKHGFLSPIRIQTDEAGYNYTVTLIFRSGRLYEKPILSGGTVHNVSSGTIFDALTPGTLLEAVVP